MKLPLLAASVVANLVLVAVFAFRPALAPPALRGILQRYLPIAYAPAAEVAATPKAAPKPAAIPTGELWNRLVSDDPQSLVARLRAAGFPPEIVRAVVTAQVIARFDPQMRALQGNDPSVPFWQLRNSSADPKRQEAQLALSMERSRILRDLAKDPFFASLNTNSRPAWAGTLPDQKIKLVEQIEADYSEMMSAARTAAGNVMLPADREKLAYLEREKRADLAGILSPEQLAEYELRTSPLTRTLGSQFNTFEPTDAEFRSMYQVYRTLSDKFPGGVTNSNQVNQAQREELANQLEGELRTHLGDARYLAFLRETSNDYRNLTRLVQSEKLPASTALEVYNQRDVVERESNRIFDDPVLSVDQKRLALQQLAQTSRAQLNAALGATAGPAYENNYAYWLRNLEQGSAVSFSLKPNVIISNGTGTYSFGGSAGATYRRLPAPATGPAQPPPPLP